MDQHADLLAAAPLPPGRGLAAVSGGPDSVALLRLLHRRGIEVQVGHVNHGLRGPDSDADADFVRDLAAQLRVPCHVGVIPVAEQARGANLEATARRLRYRWLTETAWQLGAAWVATGHTADDQAETVLFHFLRGSGPRGLRGIAPARRLAPGVRLVRPLLAVRRASLLDFLRDLNQPYRVDQSNADLRFTRNRLRHQVLPWLIETCQPRLVEHLVQFAAQMRAVQRAQERRAARLLRRSSLPKAGPMAILQAQALCRAPADLVAEALVLLFVREGWPRGRMTARHWRQAAAVCQGQATAVDLPAGLTVRHAGQVVQIGPQTL